jgi:hypothetical protein
MKHFSVLMVFHVVVMCYVCRYVADIVFVIVAIWPTWSTVWPKWTFYINLKLWPIWMWPIWSYVWPKWTAFRLSDLWLICIWLIWFVADFDVADIVFRVADIFSGRYG